MTPSKLFFILRARWLLLALVIVLTTVTAAVVSLRMTKMYVASASVVIDAKPDPVSAMMYPGLSSPAFMNTQVDVINSDRVALLVIRELKLTELPSFREQWQRSTKGVGSMEQWLAVVLRGAMDVRPAKESNVLTVTYKAPSPDFAAQMANAFVKAYLAINLELRVEPARQYAGYFGEQAKAARDKLEEAKHKLSVYERENGILASDERLDIETARLNELSSQLVGMQAVAAESSSRQSQIGASGDRLPEVLNNSLVVQLRADLGRGESRLQELSTRLGDAHPQVQEARAAVAEMRTRLETEARRVTGGVAVANNINRQREADVRASLEQQRAKVIKLKAARDEAGVLMREVESAQRAYESITTRLNQTNLESQNTQSNVNVLSAAVPPLQAASPNVKLNTVLAFVVGLVMAGGLALVLELLDRKVRGADDVTELLKLPMLGVLPAGPKPGRNKPLPAPQEQRLLSESGWAAPGKGHAT